MTVALAGQAPATFEIKSASLPLVALLLKSPDLSRLAEEWQVRFGDMPDFFSQDPLVIDLSPLARDVHEVDFAALVRLLRDYRVVPIGVKGGSETLREQAQRVGLAVADEALLERVASMRTEADDTPHPSPLPRGEREEQPALSEASTAEQPAVVVSEAPPAPVVPPSALVIDRPLRSGQQVYARGRDLVVLSMVNPGAEVIADGHVHVYAPLRGKAIAGARGNTQARILTLCLEPELVSIAGVYRTTDVPLPDAVRGKPAQIRLEGEGKLVMEPFAITQRA